MLFVGSKPQLPRPSQAVGPGHDLPSAGGARARPPQHGRPAGNTHGSHRPRRLRGAHPLPGLRPPRGQPSAGLGCLLSLGHRIILALAEGTDGNCSHMESEALSDSALAESRHLRGNCGRWQGDGGRGGRPEGRRAPGRLQVSQEAGDLGSPSSPNQGSQAFLP